MDTLWHVLERNARNDQDKGVPLYLSYPDGSLDEQFLSTVEKYPEETALLFFGSKISYEGLGNAVQQLARALSELGIHPGDRVALLLPNCPQYVISYYAILHVGGVAVPVNPLSTESELLHIFRDAQVRVVMSLDLLAGKLEKVRDTCRLSEEPQLLEYTFYTSLNEFMPFPLKLFYPLTRKLSSEAKTRLKKAKRWNDLLFTDYDLFSKHSPTNHTQLKVKHRDMYNDLAVLIYTGGTTGKPKGVMLSHFSLVANACQAAAWVEMNESDRLLTVLPVFHGFGMSVCMNAPLISGASCILVPRFNQNDLLRAIHRFRPTLFAGVPTMYISLNNHPRLERYDLSSLRGCFVGAAPLAPEVKRRFESLTGSKLMEGYGLTEAVTALCANPYQGINKTGSIGIPFPDVQIQIRDIDSGERELPPHEVGELALTCPELMLGYYNRPDETAYALRNGWLYTGDLGYRDEDGYFYIVDRKKDMIITGGFNVYPREVEDVLYEHPAVKEACVIGVPDDYHGERVMAFVSLKEDETANDKELISFCRQSLLPYKVPQTIEIRSDLPKTAIGKILRRALREQYLEQYHNRTVDETARGSTEAAVSMELK